MTDESAQVVVIGGGAIGLSIACHLGRLGVSEVLLLERDRLTSGTSWHAAGIVGPLRASMNLTRLAKYALELFVELEIDTGQATGYRQTGGVLAGATPGAPAGVAAYQGDGGSLRAGYRNVDGRRN